MGPTLPWSLTRYICSVFAERRVYIRSGDTTRYVSIRPATQVAALAVVAGLLGWSGFATSVFISGAMDGHTVQSQAAAMTEAYQAKLAAYADQQRALEQQLNEANLRRDEVTRRLSEKQAQLVETANSLQEASAELDVVRGKFEALLDARRDDANRIAALDAELSDQQAKLAATETVNANLDGTLATLTGTMERVTAERDAAVGSEADLGAELTQLTTEMQGLRDREERLLSQLEEAARMSFDGLETLFSRSSIDVDRILAQARRDYGGAGGPFEPIAEGDEAGDTLEGDIRVAALMNDLETVNLMRFAADRLPFGLPVEGARLTSGYGPRRDPKGRGRGMHNGLDLAAPRGTAVQATAGGVVTFVGRQRGYGLVVKIRHAFGFETVYAHNSRVRVKVGQRVARGDRVSDVGSTGRSTGNHLHYEIRIDSKPVNPVKFIKAARDVL